jgi:hypothetical protein
MRGTHETNWSDLEAAAKERAGNWQHDQFFAWQMGRNLEDADQWMIYTTKRDRRLRDQRDEAEIQKRLRPFSEGTDPDVVFKQHSHRELGYVTGFFIRVYQADGSITATFEEFCRIKQEHSDRKYAATLENYRRVMWNFKDQLPEGWESQVWSWFDAAGWVGYTWASDEKGGRPPKEYILLALESLGLIERKQTPLSSQRPGQVYLKAYRAMLRRVRR